MAGPESVNISHQVLKSAGFKNLSMRAHDNSLDRQDLLEVKQVAKQELDLLKQQLVNKDNSILEEHFKDPAARSDL